MKERVYRRLQLSQALISEVMDTLTDTVIQAGESLFKCFVNDRKVIMCSDEASSMDMRYFSSCCINSFESERPGLKTLILEDRCAGSLLPSQARLSNQLQTIADPGDILIVLALSEHIEHCIALVQEAHTLGMSVLSILGPDSIPVLDVLTEDDMVIPIDHSSPAHVKEVRLLVIHILLDVLDGFLLG